MAVQETTNYPKVSPKDKANDPVARAIWWAMMTTRFILPGYMLWMFYSAFG